MIAEPRFTPEGQYLINCDADRAAVALKALELIAGGAGGKSVEEIRRDAQSVVDLVETARYKVRVRYWIEGQEDDEKTRDFDVLLRGQADPMHACDVAADRLYDWANDHGAQVQIAGSAVLEDTSRRSSTA